METPKIQRFGKPYYRSNYVPPNIRQGLEDRLQLPVISSHSSSSWTFSSSHYDAPKPKKGRLWGTFLIGAALVVVLTVVAIAGLAFYIGGYTSDKHKLNEYQTKNNTNAKFQFPIQSVGSTQKSNTQIFKQISSEDQISKLVSQIKAVPEGAIFGISEAMKKLKGLNKNTKEKSTTETFEDYFKTTLGSKQSNEPTENVNISHEKLTTSFEFTDVGFSDVGVETNYDFVDNEHARPTLVAVTTRAETAIKSKSTSTSFFSTNKENFEEPWRPILPPYRNSMRITNSYQENKNTEVEFRHRQGPSVNPTLTAKDSPIAFSNKSFNQNLKVITKHTDNTFNFQNHNSSTSSKIDAKNKNVVSDHETQSSLDVTETSILTDDIVTVPFFRSQDAVFGSEVPKQPKLTTVFYYSEKSNIKNEDLPRDVDQTVSGTSLVERNIVSSTSETLRSFYENNQTEKVRVKTELIATPTTLQIFKSQAPVKSTESSAKQSFIFEANSSIENPFQEDDSRSSSFNFGIPDFPLLKQFHHLDSLLKSFTKTTLDTNFPKLFTKNETEYETIVTRFPVRKKQTTITSHKKEYPNFYEFSTVKLDSTTVRQPKPVVVKGEVEVVSVPVTQISTERTTLIPKLITLLPVKSNVDMMRPLRPRPKMNLKSTGTDSDRKSKMNLEYKFNQSPNTETEIIKLQQPLVDDKNRNPWVYYSSSTYGRESEKVFDVTPEPMTKTSQLESYSSENLTNVPLYNTIETLLSLDSRKRPENRGCRNTSEIVKDLIKVVGNVAISTGDSAMKVNDSLLNLTKEKQKKKGSEEETEKLSMTVDFSHYKLNKAGLPILTKILHKAPISVKEGGKNSKNKLSESDEKGCGQESIKCGNGTCISFFKKCNQIVDCPNAEDEKNCTCAEYLKTQGFQKKVCDGVVDCWDFTDEYNCQWCQEEFLCSNSKICISKSQICDGEYDCPFGDDEKRCITISPSKEEAETLKYHNNGYLMMRKNGYWAKLCVDNFDSISMKAQTEWKLSDLGRVVCKALTFNDFDKVEKLTSDPINGNATQDDKTDKYYELVYGEKTITLKQSLRLRETDCSKKQVIKVACSDLECGVRPKKIHQELRKQSNEYSNIGSRRSRIVGGGNAGPGSWPWQAALYREGEFQCGGTLVSENWLLSAGHCFYQYQNAYWVARLGILRKILLFPSPYEQIRHITKIILHPRYKDNGFINDISLLKMKDSISFTDYVRPICLPKPETSIIDGTLCTVIGWGQLTEGGWIFPDTLQEVQLPILSSSECRKKTVFFPLYKITDEMFCAGYERGGRDACLGDSGGPLMCLGSNGRWSLFGITSNGYGCARSNRPGVYTKVSKYLKWIYSQISLYSESPTKNENFKRRNEFTLSDKNQKIDNVAKLISQGLFNVKLNTISEKNGNRCKGHRCPLGKCLSNSRLCNGHIECSDGSDEKGCW